MKRIVRAALLLSSLFLPMVASAIPVYFVVSEPFGGGHGDSYILPLESPADIAHARDLIRLGPAAGATIVVAGIAAGVDGINRDVLASGQPAWTWHVSRFLGFADFGAEVLDGWPSFVEQDVPGWIANTGGQIGFWSYTVTHELPVPEPANWALLSAGGAGIAFHLRRRRHAARQGRSAA